MHCGPECAPRQVQHRTFADIVRLGKLASAAGTLQLSVPSFAPHPQLQHLGLLVDDVLVYAVPRPLKNTCELVVSRQFPSLIGTLTSRQRLRTHSQSNLPPYPFY